MRKFAIVIGLVMLAGPATSQNARECSLLDQLKYSKKSKETETILNNLTTDEKLAWIIWRQAFIDTSLVIDGKTQNNPEDWLNHFHEARSGIIKMSTKKAPLVFVLAADAQERGRFCFHLASISSNYKSGDPFVLRGRSWYKAIEDMRCYAH